MFCFFFYINYTERVGSQYLTETGELPQVRRLILNSRRHMDNIKRSESHMGTPNLIKSHTDDNIQLNTI